MFNRLALEVFTDTASALMLICFVSVQTQVISWPLLQKTNDVSNAKSLCRLAWQPKTGKVSLQHVCLHVTDESLIII